MPRNKRRPVQVKRTERGHLLRGLAAQRAREAQEEPRREALQRQEEALLAERDLHAQVLAAAQLGAARCDQQLRELQACVRGLRTARELGLLQPAGVTLQAIRLLKGEETVTISGASWRAEVRLEEEPVLRLAVLQLLHGGRVGELQAPTVKSEQLDGGALQEPSFVKSEPLEAEEPEEEELEWQELEGQEPDFLWFQEEVNAEPKEPADKLPASTARVTKDVIVLSASGPGERSSDKTALLQKKVRVLKNVWCNRDPAWVLQLLERQAGTLEKLELLRVTREVLLALQRMSWARLRRLRVWHCTEDLEQDPQLPEEWQGPGLQRLDVKWLPKQTVRSLLRAHRHSLRELELYAGCPAGAGEEFWPESCSDLPALLEGLRLRSLALERFCEHDAPRCRAQLAALRAALPGCSVSCRQETCED